VYHPRGGNWFIWGSQANAFMHNGPFNWGNFEKMPAPGDYDGDGKADKAVFDMNTGTRTYCQSKDGLGYDVEWGGPIYAVTGLAFGDHGDFSGLMRSAGELSGGQEVACADQNLSLSASTLTLGGVGSYTSGSLTSMSNLVGSGGTAGLATISGFNFPTNSLFNPNYGLNMGGRLYIQPPIGSLTTKLPSP
jgi:hypothetical protein